MLVVRAVTEEAEEKEEVRVVVRIGGRSDPGRNGCAIGLEGAAGEDAQGEEGGDAVMELAEDGGVVGDAVVRRTGAGAGARVGVDVGVGVGVFVDDSTARVMEEGESGRGSWFGRDVLRRREPGDTGRGRGGRCGERSGTREAPGAGAGAGAGAGVEPGLSGNFCRHRLQNLWATWQPFPQ